MKVFSFIKKVFVLGLTVLSKSITGALNCVSMNNQKCEVRPKIIDVNSNSPMFYPFSVKKIGVVVTVITLMIDMQRFVFLILEKISMLKYLI